MNNTIAFLKRLRLARIVIVFLAGVVLLISTACSQSPNLNASNTRSDRPSANSPYQLDKNTEIQMKESHPTTPSAGQTSSNKDVNARGDASGAAQKANDIYLKSDRRVPRYVEHPEQALRKNREGLEKASDRVSNSAEEMKEGAERGARNLKENIKSAVDNVVD
jgi:hypothetical protein